MHATTHFCDFVALSGGARSRRPSSLSNATVIIKTFQFSICVTGMKHPDACKNAGADAHVVVSDDKIESLDLKIGQAASIMAVPGKGLESSPRSRIVISITIKARPRNNRYYSIASADSVDLNWPTPFEAAASQSR